jgi:hypothetical protein
MDAASRLLIRASGTYSVTEEHTLAEDTPG